MGRRQKIDEESVATVYEPAEPEVGLDLAAITEVSDPDQVLVQCVAGVQMPSKHDNSWLDANYDIWVSLSAGDPVWVPSEVARFLGESVERVN